MKPGRKSLIFVVLIATLTLAGLSRAETQDSVFLKLFPGLRTMPAPAWLKPGIRLTFYSGGATISGLRRDRRTGLRRPGGLGGVGYTQLDVVAVQGNTTVVSMLQWTIDPTSRHVAPPGLYSFISPAGDGNDFWLSPLALRRIKSGNYHGLQIKVGPYRLKNGGTRPAVYFRYQVDKSLQTWVFDRTSGLLLSYSSQNVTRAFRGTGRGLSQTFYVGIRRRRFPWQGDPPPAWLARVRELRYQGATENGMAGATPLRRPFDFDVRVVNRGADWIGYRSVVTRPGLGPMPPSRNEVILVSGAAQVGGLWLPPAGIARLRPGMVLDQDPATGVSQLVHFVGPMKGMGRVLVIREKGPLHTTDYVYDVANGALVFLKTTQRIGLGFKVTYLRLRNMR